MDSWNVYSQNTPSTEPTSTWLCPQNNNPGSDWLHTQNNTTERERENTALATPTRFIMEYNDVNQNSSPASYFNNPYQEMERIFENSFLKLGNPEDLLNNDMYNNDNLSSWLNTNETVIPVTTSSNIPTTNGANSPTPSLVMDNDREKIYLQKEERIQNSASFQYPVTTLASVVYENQQMLKKMPSCSQSADNVTLNVDENQEDILQKNQQEHHNMTMNVSPSSSPISPISPVISNNDLNLVQQKNPQDQRYPMTTSSTFYQPALTYQQRLFHSTSPINDTTSSSKNLHNQDQYLLAKKHDPKQLLLPLTTSKASMDGTMTVAITSPSPSLATDEDMDPCRQTKTKSRRQSYQDIQLSISTNDLPMQQPSPASSEYYSSSTKTPPSSNDTTPKQKKRRVSQRKTSSKKTAKLLEEETLISPVDESYSEQDLMSSTTIAMTSSTESSSSNDIVTSISSEAISTSSKRNASDDGHEETPDEKRARLLERNRIAAAKCRQKKKQAQENLQQQASDLTQKNTTMHSLVNDLREEALKLKNHLLAHSTCNCNVIQEYVRTSGQFAFARGSYTK